MSIEIEVGLENVSRVKPTMEELKLEQAPPKGLANPRIRFLLFGGGLVLLVLLISLFLYYRNRESTDDAGVDGPRTQLNTQSGTSNADAQLAGAQADLMRAQSTYDQAQTSDLAWAQANIEKSKANAQLGQADLERYRPLMEKGEI